MSQDKIDILQRALLREKAARKQAEKILEEKSSDLYFANKRLEELYKEVESELTRTDSQLQGVFENIVDAYVIMDLFGNILEGPDKGKRLSSPNSYVANSFAWNDLFNEINVYKSN